MDFNLVLNYLQEFFNKNKIPYALIGGLALNIHGIVRTTQDIDFILESSRINIVEEYLLSHGYKKLFRNEEIASYISDNFILGRIDFLLAHRKYTMKMLESAVKFDSKSSSFKIPVVRLENIIGLKLQAYFNRKERKLTDMEDIRNIIDKFKSDLDFNLIKEYFSLFNANDMLTKLWKDKNNAH